MNDYTRNAQEKTYYVPEGFTAVGGNGGTGEKADIFKLKEANTSFMGVIERRILIVHKGKPANKNYVAYDVAVDTRYKPLAATTAPAVQTQQSQQQPNYVQPVANPNINPVYQNQQQPYNGAGNGTNNNQNNFVPSSQIDDDLPF